MYRGGDKDMKKDHDDSRTAIGTILVKTFVDKENTLQFETAFGGFEDRCPSEFKDDDIIKDIFDLNKKLKEHYLNNSKDKYNRP